MVSLIIVCCKLCYFPNNRNMGTAEAKKECSQKISRPPKYETSVSFTASNRDFDPIWGCVFVGMCVILWWWGCGWIVDIIPGSGPVNSRPKKKWCLALISYASSFLDFKYWRNRKRLTLRSPSMRDQSIRKATVEHTIHICVFFFFIFLLLSIR